MLFCCPKPSLLGKVYSSLVALLTMVSPFLFSSFLENVAAGRSRSLVCAAKPGVFEERLFIDLPVVLFYVFVRFLSDPRSEDMSYCRREP